MYEDIKTISDEIKWNITIVVVKVVMMRRGYKL